MHWVLHQGIRGKGILLDFFVYSLTFKFRLLCGCRVVGKLFLFR